MPKTIDIEPLYDRILVEKIEIEEVSDGGIVLPSSARDKERQVEATVLAVGEGYPLEDGGVRPLKTQVGDTVIVEKFAGTDFKFGDLECTLLREENILGILRSA